MSFGFSVSDLLAIGKIAKDLYEECKHGPAEYQEICHETKSPMLALNDLARDTEDSESTLTKKGLNRKKELDDLIEDC